MRKPGCLPGLRISYPKYSCWRVTDTPRVSRLFAYRCVTWGVDRVPCPSRGASGVERIMFSVRVEPG